MKYLVLKPRGDSSESKSFEEFDVNKINSPQTFIQQQVGTEAVARLVGDYILWISNPVEKAEDESGEVFNVQKNFDKINLTANALLNEFELAYGNIVVTSNYKITRDLYKGLNTQDIANVMNAFVKSNSLLVENGGKQLVVDAVIDSILSPNGLSDIELEEPEIPDLGEPDDDEYENSLKNQDDFYSDEDFEETIVINEVDDAMLELLNDEEIQSKLNEL